MLQPEACVLSASIELQIPSIDVPSIRLDESTCISPPDFSLMLESPMNTESWRSRCESTDNCESPIPLSPPGSRHIDEEDWESMIEDAVSSLTGHSTKSEPVLHHSASIDWINITPTNFLRASISCGSIGSTGSTGSTEDDRAPVPCIFDDYCNLQHRQAEKKLDDAASCVDLYKSRSDLTKSTALSISDEFVLKKDECNNGNGASSAKSLDAFGCEGSCFVSGEDAVLFVVDGKSKLKAGSIDRMVQRLTCDIHNDPEFTSAFLLTYRYLLIGLCCVMC